MTSGYPGTGISCLAADGVNIPKGERGVLPTDDDGRALNMDFEKGTLDDWKVEGEAFAKGQPVKGEIDKNRPFGGDKKSEHTGEFWIGGYEVLRDEPVGTLTSAPFQVTHPWASFLVAGGSHPETRVELVSEDDGKPFFAISGLDQENLRPVVIDLSKLMGKKIFVRIVDEHSGGWGHVNFDDFRFYEKRPVFAEELKAAPAPGELYPLAGVDAEAAAKAMELPPGFSVQVGAAEPDVQQPIAMALDDRGRVWVVEAFTYPIRAPEGKGRDRILIFEDTDNDGRLDKRTVFIEGLNLVSGMEVGFGGVWVGAAPYLLFIPDRDGDDKPDGEPEILLDGWAFQDTHETLNAFNWGPDGWLYGCHGVFTHSRVGKPGTPDEKRIPINAGYWRYHPVRHEFEVFAEGTSNSWGIDWDDYGQAIATACVIPHLYHVIQGARYERQAGEHFNPHTYNDIKTIADHFHYVGNQWNNADRLRSHEMGGGHAHAGAMIYLGNGWPEEYRGRLFMSNIHGNRVNMDILSPRGSGYVGSHGPDFLLSRDQWSQMLNFRYGPDGQVWAIDWYDANQCHHNDPRGHDQSNGRIYRIAYEGAEPVSVDLTSKSDRELMDLQGSDNEWYVRHARRLLQERAAAGELDASIRGELADLAKSYSLPRRQLRALWTLHVTGGVPEETADALLSNRSEHVRAWTIQLLMEDKSKPPTDALLARLAELARRDPSPVVRLYLASALQRLPLERRWDILAGLLTHPEDASDHNLPLMYWYAAEPLADADAKRALALGLIGGRNVPALAGFMVRRIGSGGAEQSLALLVDGLGESKDDAMRLTYLQGINAALGGRRKADAPASWAKVYDALRRAENVDVRLEAMALAVTFGDANAADALTSVASDAKSSIAQRRAALRHLVKSRSEGTLPLLRNLVADASLRGDALRALAEFDDAQTPALILNAYATLTPDERRQALSTLCSRPAYAAALLDAVEARRVAAGDLSADLVRQVRNLGSDELTRRLEEVWGTVRDVAEDRVALIEQTRNLAQSPGPAPDAELGRAVFSRTCQQCHTLFGTGGSVGPDLTGSNRANLDYLLSNILDPSAVMAREYQPSVIYTTGGRVITGIVRSADADALRVQTADELIVVPRGEIDEQVPGNKSMMPDGILAPLSRHDVRSLLAYLGNGGQSPLLATSDNVSGFFDGRSLAGWRGDEKLWSVESGEIVGKTEGLAHNNFLVSEMALEDFELELEVKLVKNEGNSGIQIRSVPLDDGEMRGYQADIGAGWWGKLYEENGRALLWDISGEEHVKLGDWNTYRIRAIGSRVQTWINGQACVDLDDPKGARRGVVGLQLHSGGPTEVRFRNFRLTLLNQAPPLVAVPASTGGRAEGKIAFDKTQLDAEFRSEGVAVGDFNNDGLMDIAAGNMLYPAPDWKPQPLLDGPKAFDPHGYSDSFCNFAVDVNRDGRLDLVVVDFPGKQTWWLENPGSAGGEWKRHEAAAVTNNESPGWIDIDGDERGALLFSNAQQRMGIARPPANAADADSPWEFSIVSEPSALGTAQYAHGLGAGDVNGDGRIDVLVPQGWWEAPVEASTQSTDDASQAWQFHQVDFGPDCAQMYAFDVDGDSDADVASSSAHNIGVWWHEQTPDGWKRHEISKDFSQSHSLSLADINGDGLPDLVTGKRWWAHGPSGDVGADQPAVVYWFELSRAGGKVEWIPHQIDHDSGIGTQFQVADVDGDGLLDIVTSNKNGVFYLRQNRE